MINWLWTDKVEVYANLNRLKTATDMDDRCRIIKEMGGRFYEYAECPELTQAVGEDKKSKIG